MSQGEVANGHVGPNLGGSRLAELINEIIWTANF